LSNPSVIKPTLAVLGANLIFAANFSIVQFLTPNFMGSFGLNLMRVFVATSLFWLIALFRKSKDSLAFKKEHLGRFLLCALTGIAINQLLFVKGLTLTSTIHASLLILFTPIAITVMAFFLLKEKLTIFSIAGLVAGIIGALLLVSEKENIRTGTNLILGDVFIILNAISYAFYFVLVRKLMAHYSPIHVLRWVFTFGTIMILPFGWQQFAAIQWSTFGWDVWKGCIFVTVGATFMAYLLNIFSLQQLGAAKTGSYIYTQPIFAAIIGVFILHEEPSFVKLLAAIFIFLGVYLVNKKK
jgi:drug/metabolite transporter (DMT)-like permease